jgi:nucleoside-diphosphate-sugar epimerase
MNILLTGVSGFSGHRLAIYLLKQGHFIFGLSRSNISIFKNIKNFKLIIGDLKKINNFSFEVDAIIHVAATSTIPGISVDKIIADNILATNNLINVAKKKNINRILFFSSLSVYGDIKSNLVDINTIKTNADPYGMSKLFGEYCLMESSKSINSLSIRLPAIVGGGATRHWLASSLAKIKKNENIIIFNPNNYFNNAIHIDQLSIFINKWLNMNINGFDAITIASDGYIKIIDIIDKMKLMFNSNSEIIINSNNTKSSFTISNSDAIAKYNYNPINIYNTLEAYFEEEMKL